MVTIENNYIRAVCSWEATGIFTEEPCIVEVTALVTGLSLVRLIDEDTGETVAVFTFFNSFTSFDIADIVRLYPSLSLAVDIEGSQPLSLSIPTRFWRNIMNDVTLQDLSVAQSGKLLQPSVIYRVPSVTIPQNVAFTAASPFSFSSLTVLPSTPQLYYGLAPGFDTTLVVLEQEFTTIGSDAGTTLLREVPCGVRWCLAEWSDRYTGDTKRMVWLVRDFKTSAVDRVSLDRLDRQYHGAVDTSDELTLYLPDLDAYDTYYYSDILTSPAVKLTWFRPDTNYTPVTSSVEVTTKSVTIPDGSETADLSIMVKYVTYAKTID